MYSKFGQIYKEMGELYDTGPLSGSKPVNVALIGTGRCYQEISEVYENQVIGQKTCLILKLSHFWSICKKYLIDLLIIKW